MLARVQHPHQSSCPSTEDEKQPRGSSVPGGCGTQVPGGSRLGVEADTLVAEKLEWGPLEQREQVRVVTSPPCGSK